MKRWPSSVTLPKKKRIEAKLRRYHKNLETLVEERTTDLYQAEKKYRRIFNHSGSPSIIVAQDFTILMANPKFEELTGYARAAIEDRMQWINFIADHDRERVQRYHFSRRSGNDQVPVEYECQIIDRQGNIKDIFIKVGMLPEPGAHPTYCPAQTKTETTHSAGLHWHPVAGWVGGRLFLELCAHLTVC